MPWVTLKSLYEELPSGEYAIGAFNVHNMEYTQAVVKAAEMEDAPVILMIGERAILFAGLDMLVAICQHAARHSSAPVAITLDHGRSLDLIDRCIELGISVMFDGSMLPFEENIRITRDVVRKAHARGVSVEGELGTIAGPEDDETFSKESMTDPDIAARFVEETGVDALAIAIGNRHGFYSGTPKLDLERLERIRDVVKVPLVLHGGSDLPESLCREVIVRGIRKFNVGTDLKYAFSSALRQVLSQDPLPYQPWTVLGPARDAVVEVTRGKLRLFGSSGQAKHLRNVL